MRWQWPRFMDPMFPQLGVERPAVRVLSTFRARVLRCFLEMPAKFSAPRLRSRMSCTFTVFGSHSMLKWHDSRVELLFPT